MVTVAAGLTIGSRAERTGCNVPTIRYYEEIGLLPKPSRLPGGHRVYAEGDLKRLTFIRRCRHLGFPIEPIRDLVALTDNPGRDCTEAKDLAEAHLVAVRSKLRELKSLEMALSHFTASCSTLCAGGPACDCVILEDLAKPAPRCG